MTEGPTQGPGPDPEPSPTPPEPSEPAPSGAEPAAPEPTASPPATPPSAPPQRNSDQQMWQVLAHASAFIQLLGIPSLVGPLIVWFVKREDPAVEPHARAALNFQLSLLIYFVVGGFLAILFAITVVGLALTFALVLFLAALFVLELVFALLASLAASRGELYSYPMSLELIKG